MLDICGSSFANDFDRDAENIGETTILGGNKMAKRKAQFNAVEKYSKTPHSNNHEAEIAAEFSAGEEPMKGANRNSKQGRQGKGKHNERPLE